MHSVSPPAHLQIDHHRSQKTLESGSLGIVQEAVPALKQRAKNPKTENYFERINRENREYLESLKHYFDNYFEKIKDKDL